LRNLKINSDILSYLPKDDPAVELFNKVGEQFGGSSLAMVALETDDVFNAATLQRIRKLTEAYEGLDGVRDVVSLTNILDIKKIEGGLEVGKLVDIHKMPETEAELKALKDYTLSKKMYRGSLVDSSGTVTVIISRIKEKMNKGDIAKAIMQTTDGIKGSEKVYYAGLPVQMVYVSNIILGDMGKLTPAVVLLIIGILYISFRSLRGVFLPIVTVLISLIWAMGLMSIVSKPMTLISGIIPVILVAVGSAYGIHVVNKYYEDVRSESEKESGVKATLSEVGIPVILAGVTTLISFLSFESSNLSLIKEFGFFTACGVLFATLIAITFLPAVLSILKVKGGQEGKRARGQTGYCQIKNETTGGYPEHQRLLSRNSREDFIKGSEAASKQQPPCPPLIRGTSVGRETSPPHEVGEGLGVGSPSNKGGKHFTVPQTEGERWTIRFMDRWAAFVLRRKKLIVIIAAFVFIGTLAGLPFLSREVSMVEYFKKDSEIRLAEELMEEKFGGSIPVQFYVKGDIKNPFVLKQMRMAEKYLESLPDVNDPQSVATLICELNDVMNDRYTIPETEEGVGNLWFFIEGNEILDQLINSQQTEAVIQAKLGTMDTGRVIELVDAVNRYLSLNVPKDLIKVNLQEADETVRKKLEEIRIKRIAEQIALDVKRRMPDHPLDLSKLELILAKGIQESETSRESGLAEETLRKIGDYFLSDAADITLKETDIEKVKAAFHRQFSNPLTPSPLIPLTRQPPSPPLLRGMGRGLWGGREVVGKGDGNPSFEEAKTILSSNIDKETIAEDPDAVDYAAKSIVAIIAEVIREGRVSMIMEKLQKELPFVHEVTEKLPRSGRSKQELENDDHFLSDLKADVWEINENWMAISKTEYASIFGKENGSLDPIILSIQQAGMAPVYKELDKQLVGSQIISMLSTLLLVFLLLWAQLRNIVGGLISVTPIALTILVNFGVMSYLGVPLDIATIMVASIAIGIGVDYTIHFTSRFKQEFVKQASIQAALEKTLETTGVAIVINALSVMMGFLVLMMSSLAPLQRFGWLTALTMFTSSLGAITVLPALILLTKARFVSNKTF
jgi:predicted RND superfamily exporter protein